MALRILWSCLLVYTYVNSCWVYIGKSKIPRSYGQLMYFFNLTHSDKSFSMVVIPIYFPITSYSTFGIVSLFNFSQFSIISL